MHVNLDQMHVFFFVCFSYCLDFFLIFFFKLYYQKVISLVSLKGEDTWCAKKRKY